MPSWHPEILPLECAKSLLIPPLTQLFHSNFKTNRSLSTHPKTKSWNRQRPHNLWLWVGWINHSTHCGYVWGNLSPPQSMLRIASLIYDIENHSLPRSVSLEQRHPKLNHKNAVLPTVSTVESTRTLGEIDKERKALYFYFSIIGNI